MAEPPIDVAPSALGPRTIPDHLPIVVGKPEVSQRVVVGEIDPATLMAIEERTWPRGSSRVLADTKSTDERAAATDEIVTDEQLPHKGPRYQLGTLIGRGGMGEVFAAYDAQLGREVAIKRLHRDKITTSSLARFAAEARIQGWLDHPAIPSVYELGRDDAGRPFFVMKRLSGLALDEILHERERDSQASARRFTEQQLLRAFVEICLAVEFAHTRGVIHRDLKPANMLLGEFGEVYVLDWGVADVLASGTPHHDGRPTIDHSGNTGGALGTPGYMAPEQVAGEALDGRADVYALGCVLFEILVGKRLHPAGFAGMTSALAGVEDSPAKHRDIAPELDELCRRATTADRAHRIGSARALGEAVQRYLDGDRDLGLRRKLARTHFEAAYRASDQLRGAPSLESRADLEASAMREAGRALALDPTLPGAAELVSWLMLQPSARPPAPVIDELAQAQAAEQTRMSKISVALYAGYAGLAPLLFVLGIRDLPYLGALLGVAIGNVVIAKLALAKPKAISRFVIALGHAAMFALIARMFTPLLIAPGIAAVTLMAYAQHPTTTRRELVTGIVLALVAVLGVLGAEASGLLSATTIVSDGVVQLVSPLDGVADFPIIPLLCCYLVLLVIVAVELTFNMARRDREARRELHVRAWQLRQLASLDAPASYGSPPVATIVNGSRAGRVSAV